LLRDVQVRVVGKVFKPNRLKVSALNRALNEYFSLKEGRKVNQQLHITANQIVAYAKQFPKPLIVMKDLNGARSNFKKSKGLNRRFHTLPFRRLQAIIEYKALFEGIEVKYLTKKETRGTSKKCHRCGHVAQERGREIRRLKCGLRYNRDLNACINISHVSTGGMGWGSPPNRQMWLEV
jgi:IS605 OrfB family transposase